MTTRRLIDVDITDRANGKLPVWNSTAGTHVYEDPSSSGVPAGTSFPGSPSTNDLFYRTDRGLLYFYDGTRWLTTQVFPIELKREDYAGFPANSQVPVHRATVPFGGVYDVYLLTWYPLSSVITTNTGSAYWTAYLYKFNSAGGGDTSIASFNTSADSANAVVQKAIAINALLGSFVGFYTDAVKTSTPGVFRFHGGHVTTRLVG